MKNILFPALLFWALLFLVFANSPICAADDTVLAKIGNEKITMDDFNRFIVARYDAKKQQTLEKNPEYKANILVGYVQRIVLSKIAKEKGFDKRPDIKDEIEFTLNDLLATEYLKKEVIDKIKVSEEDMKLYYKGHQDEFGTVEMVRVRHILFKPAKPMAEDDWKNAKTKAEDVLKRIKAGEDFERLAAEFSDDASSKTKGGDLGFFPKGKMVPDFEKAAFSLKPGEIEIVKTPYGYHIIKLEDKKISGVEPFEQVKNKVEEKVFAEFKKAKVDEFLKGAMEEAGVQMNLEAFLKKK